MDALNKGGQKKSLVFFLTCFVACAFHVHFITQHTKPDCEHYFSYH